MSSVAEVIAQGLAEAGCRHAFGIPGGEVVALVDALDRAGLRVVLSKHENCAGFMGEGVYHHDGAPAVLFATIGPGLANAANVIANAWQDRVPMIVLSGCVGDREYATYTHQVFDHEAFLKPITKATFRVRPENADVLVRKALRIATEGRPGPVLLDVPVDLQRAEAKHAALRPAAKVAISGLQGPDLVQAQGWLEAAQRPIIIAGVDALNYGAELTALAEHLHAPVITTYKAKGLLREDHPLALGGAGLSPLADKTLVPLVQASDCILLAGYDPVEVRPGWRDVWDDVTPVIEISAEANRHDMHQARLEFVGQVGQGLRDLQKATTKKLQSWPDGEPAKAKAALARAFPDEADWGPIRAIRACRAASPKNTVATADSGAHRIVLSQIWPCYEPRGLLQSSALCTMGCAVPLAIGRKLAEPDRPVVAFVGDAGLEMFLGELATIRDLGLCIPIVVFVDGELALIELKQRNMQFKRLAVRFGETDFPAVAKALGGHGVTCPDGESLQAELAAAYHRSGFTVIAVPIGQGAYDGKI